MLELMREVQSRHNISFIYITHDLATARNFGHRIGILYQGAIVETGPIDEVLLSPRHPYTQALTDAISEPDPRNLHKRKSIRIVTESHDGRQAAGGRDGCIEPSELNINISGGCRFAQKVSIRGRRMQVRARTRGKKTRAVGSMPRRTWQWWQQQQWQQQSQIEPKWASGPNTPAGRACRTQQESNQRRPRVIGEV